MAGGARSELASGSPESCTVPAAYPNGPRGSYPGPIMERTSSFRESLDNRGLPSSSGTARSPASVTVSPVEVALLEPPCFPEQKHSRFGELRRIFGSSMEDHPSSSSQSKSLQYEDFKHIKALAIDARERAKQFQECIVKVDRCRSIQTRKKQRNENASFEKSSGSSLLKMGSQVPSNPPDVAQRLDDRTKNSVPNRRVRSSVAEQRSEGRGNMLPRQSSTIDKDKNVTTEKEKNLLRPCGGGSNPIEEKNRGLSGAGDGWDKNMKRKRSMGPLAARTVDLDRELKQSTQQRVGNESHTRTNDGLGFSRPGSSNGVNVINRDGCSQANVASARNPSKSDLENSPADRRERVMLDRERTITKGNIKQPVREDSPVGGHISLIKGKASRAPRSNPGSIMNPSHFPRTPGGHDGWEQNSNLTKVQPSGLPNNRKRPLPMGPSSPPVAQWVGQRTQKSSRTRRTNLVSPVSGHEESPIMSEGFSSPDTGAKLTNSEPIAPGMSRTTSNSSQQPKLKTENAPSPAILSESEESGALDYKTQEKGTDNMEEENMELVQKVPSVMLPMKKIKNSKEESSDGVRRQGRSGRVSLQLKSAMPSKERHESDDTVKQLRTGRSSSDRSESKVGRPPSKKVSDRKAFVRPGNIINTGLPQQIGDYEDDQDDLLAAATFVRNSCCVQGPHLSSTKNNAEAFWDKIKPYFAFINPNDRDWIKQQITFLKELDGSLNVDIDNESQLTYQESFEVHASEERKSSENMLRSNRHLGASYPVCELHPSDATLGNFGSDRWFERLVPLSQRLLAAIIPDDEFEILGCNTNERVSFTQVSGDHSFETSCHASLEAKENGNRLELDHELEWTSLNQRNASWANSTCNGHATLSNYRGSATNNQSYNNGSAADTNIHPCSDFALPSEYMNVSLDGMQNSGLSVSNPSPSDCQYEDMSIDDKVLLELQSIGLCPETVPDLAEGEDEEIDKEIRELKSKLYEQVRAKKDQLCRIDDAIQNSRESEERLLEQLAMNKLIVTAYGKLLGGRGGHGSNKGAKISKQAALAFTKRTLARCHKFELTGKSCFSEPQFQHVLFTPPPNVTETATAASERQLCHPDFHLTGSNKGKKKELPLDDVIGSASSKVAPFGSTFPGGAKGKRSDRDQNRDTLTKGAKAGRPSVGERKTKAKLKQKTAQLSSSGNILGRPVGTHGPTFAVVESCVAVNGASEEHGVCSLPPASTHQELSMVEESIDFCSLPLHDELGGQGQDIASWLNVDEEVLQDNDLMGLEIPMDDLSELNMNF